MKVSVHTITYNHEKYVAQSLDSILMQEADFEYEIVIGEDCSTDRTRDIVLDYQRRYPDRVRVLPRDKNLGMHRNWADTYRNCRGEYIAVLEGDDFWTSPHKLQKQADFLDANPDFAACFHNADYLYEDGSIQGKKVVPRGMRQVSTLDDIVLGNFIPSLTVMFRNGLFGDFPGWFFKTRFCDWPVHILNAQAGKMWYMDESLATYRVHPGGVTFAARTDQDKSIEQLEGKVQVYELANAHLGYRYDKVINERLSGYFGQLAIMHERNGATASAALCYLRGIARARSRARVSYLSKKLASLAWRTLRGHERR
ncbi:MAG: glycosyltransferase [Nitrospirae bacterium]|nr:glycosyltransferase [Nitrospirota bacterium]